MDWSVTIFVMFSVALISFPISNAIRKRSLEGVLSGESGMPLAGVAVSLTNLRSAKGAVCVTGEQGSFHFDDLSVMGDYQIAVCQGECADEQRLIWQYKSDCELHVQFEAASSAAWKKQLPAMSRT